MAKEERSKMEQYLALKPGVSKLEGFKLREAMWKRYYDTGVLGPTPISRDEWVAGKMRSEGWTDK